MQRPFYAVGLLYHLTDGRLSSFLGSCFSFRTPEFFLTAAHCVGTQKAPDLGVGVPAFSGKDGLAVRDIWKHDTADLAILRVDDRAKEHIAPFTHVDTITTWGESVAALGFPEDSHPDGIRPVARFFRGFVQRMFHYTEVGWQYPAYELSFGAPAGLSGGPVFPTRDIGAVCGVAAANRSATTYLSSVADVQDGPNRYTEKIHHQIEYGIAVRLDQVIDWIDSIIPR